MNWKIIIAEILLHGQLTQPNLAIQCGCGQATISDLASGKTKQPSYPLGKALITIHKKHMKKAKSTAQKDPVVA